MRHAWRLYWETRKAYSLIALSLLFTLSACSIPDVTIDRKKKTEDSGDGFFTKTSAGPDSHAGDSTYVGTVHIRFNDSALPPIQFDVRRDRRDLISTNLYQTTQTATYLHMGYSHDEGGIAGLRFLWHF